LRDIEDEITTSMMRDVTDSGTEIMAMALTSQ
jgi:hypothetical protein